MSRHCSLHCWPSRSLKDSGSLGFQSGARWPHQGDVYSASFAAVPHVISALALDPTRFDSAYFQFPASVEICRVSKNVPVPTDLQQAYFDALASLPMLAARWAAKVRIPDQSDR